MNIILGLTGSIGMGKSTTARMFADRGIPVWDADAAVHRLYAPGQPAALAVGALFPGVMEADGSVSRPRLRALIAQDPTVMDRLNAAVHPLVAIDQRALHRPACARSGARHDRGRVPDDPCPPDARCRETQARRLRDRNNQPRHGARRGR